MKRILRALMLSAWLVAAVPACATSAATVPRVPEQVSRADWAQDMDAFAARDAKHPPAKGGVLFVGSSSIRFWETLAADFPGVNVINRGFGGSQVRDSTWYAGRIVVPYAPRTVVLYAGDNDLEAGRSPQQVRDDVVAFVRRVRRDLPHARIVYLSIKPSPARARLMPAVAQANALIREAAGRMENVDFVDVYTPMLGADGQPRAELFLPDQLHMTPAGYALWRELVAPHLHDRSLLPAAPVAAPGR